MTALVAPAPWTVAPFILMLLAIAVCPLAAPPLVGVQSQQVRGGCRAGRADSGRRRGDRLAGRDDRCVDNAPTYLTFLALAQGPGLSNEVVGVPHAILAAISVGAVAMGATTYIGNAPNFMVKAIAEEAKVPMPSFGGYMLYSGAILIPLFVVTTLLFFR